MGTKQLFMRYFNYDCYLRHLSLFFIVLLSCLTNSYTYAETITPETAHKYLETVQTVCGKVASSKYASTSKGSPTFLNLNNPYPNHIFVIVIWGSDRNKFSFNPETYYKEKNICVTGKIKSYKGIPEIIAKEPSQIKVSQVNQNDSIEIITNSPLAFPAPNKLCTAKICKSLKKLIDNSRESIDFAIYGLRNQQEILESLIDAEKRGVVVRGVIDKDIFNKSYYTDTHLLEENLKNISSDYLVDKSTLKMLPKKAARDSVDKCERPEGHEGPLQCFEGKGYASKEDIQFQGDIMHNKYFIIDSRYVWTGSANISDSGIGGYNANVVVILDSRFLADYYETEFEQMFIEQKYHRKKDKLKKHKIEHDIDNQNLNLFFSPQGYTMRRGVLPLIRSAENSIDISMFFLTHKEISKELVNAYKRGVKIRIILDATGAKNEYSKHHYLRERGISLKVENWGGKMHMKAAVVDKKHMILGSMNWTIAGESKNDENTIIIKNSPKNAAQLTLFFQEIWNSIPDKWLLDDPVPESIDSGTSCSDGVDNDFDKIVDHDEVDCKL